jgi:RHS repeat-associated protein
LGLSAVSSSDITAGTNRFVSGVASYDYAGNITTDSKFRSLNYAYDANGRQTSAANGSFTETQTYDCAGQRVQTTVGGTTRTMVYDLSGQEVADYANGVLERENIYRGGQLLATTSTQTQLTASSATASNYISGNEPSKAIDGNLSTLWNSGGFPSQSITIDLVQLSTVSKVRLLIAQSPNGSTTQELYGGDTTSNLSLLGTLSGSTVNGQWLEFDPNTSNIRYLKVLTTSTPSSWVAWSEIEVYGSNPSTRNYVLTDAQGSARTVMSNNGSVIARHDYLPFGEEISSGLRGSGLGYGATDNNRQKYGLTERDDATGLDHTWWRKYENLSGRWTSPDPLSGGIGDPQSFNGYNYTGNDPVNFIDPSGLSETDPLTLVRRFVPFVNSPPVNIKAHWDDPISPGGGAGDWGGFLPLAVIAPDSKGGQRFTDALALLKEKINANRGNNDCARAFGGRDKALAALNNSKFEFKPLGGPQIVGDLVLYSARAATTEGKTVTINTQGRFYMENLSLPYTNAPGRTNPNDLDLSAITYGNSTTFVHLSVDVVMATFILGHELGHRTGIYREDDFDGSDPEKTARNNKKIYDACFSDSVSK